MVLSERGVRHPLFVENPIRIAEVLPPEAESYDQGLKFEHYRSLAGLEYYLLIAQDREHVELYEREGESSRRPTDYGGAEARLMLPKLDISLDVADIYRQVEFGEVPEAAETGTPP